MIFIIVNGENYLNIHVFIFDHTKDFLIKY